MKTLVVIFAVLLFWVPVSQAATIGDAVEVSVITDNGWSLPLYPMKTRLTLKKVYAEAVLGDHYRIVVRNKLNRRIGVVIAVDGRNIISGKKSWLKNSERMYILDPYAVNEYTGWRTGQNKINRFYFTAATDSYAAAFGDESAMGVIAVVAYPEIQRYEPPANYSQTAPERGARAEAKDKAAAPSVQSKAEERAGTGYGREEYSPSYRVQFDPESSAVETVLIKYEWRKTLCDKRIINCNRPSGYSHNRIWDNEGFAPPPPCRY